MGFEIINKIKKEKGLTNAQIAEMSGITLSTLDKITAGINKNPKLDTLQALCNVLGCSLDDFDTNPRKKQTYNIEPDILSIANKIKQLDSHGKEVVDSIIDIELKRINQNNTPEVIYIDFVSSKASAGVGFDLGQEYREKIPVVLNRITAKADFAVMVKGDSMQPKFYDGDILLIAKQPDIEVGDYGIFIKDNKGYVKKKGYDRLISLNKNYPDIFPSDYDSIECKGKVLGVLDKAWEVK